MVLDAPLEYITIVDENGSVLGTEIKEKCHQGKGILHSAFLVMIFNKKNELMLAKRSQQKLLWPDYWDGTVASHYHPDVSQEDRVKQRILYEAGARCDQIEFLFKFRYHAEYKDIGSENEICDVFTARGIPDGHVSPNAMEISEHRFLHTTQIEDEIRSNSKSIAPWFLIAFDMYSEARAQDGTSQNK